MAENNIEPTYYEKETRQMVVILTEKVDEEISKFYDKNDNTFSEILRRIDQLHERNATKLQTLESAINDRLTEFSNRNELFKNATSEAIQGIIDKYANRLPLWATFLITGLFGFITALMAGWKI